MHFFIGKHKNLKVLISEGPYSICKKQAGKDIDAVMSVSKEKRQDYYYKANAQDISVHPVVHQEQ